MHYIYDLVSDASLLSRNSLIRVCDLLRSRDLSQDINSAQKEAYTSYTAAMEGVTDLGLDEGDLAKDIITTLFLELCREQGWNVLSRGTRRDDTCTE